MKTIKCIGIMLLVGLFAGSAFAANVTDAGLTLGVDGASAPVGSDVTLPLDLATGTVEEGVGGVSFTVTYTTSKYSFVGVQSTDTIIDPINDATGLCDGGVANCPATLTAEQKTGLQSSILYQVNYDTPGEVMIAAASASKIPSGTVLNLVFTIEEEGATESDLTLGPSSIANTTAGYDAAGEEIPMIVGALKDGETSPVDEFVQKDDNGKVTSQLASATVIPPEVGDPVPEYDKGDADGEGSVTTTDALRVLRVAALLDDASELKGDCDVDGVVGISTNDALTVLRYAAQIITQWPE